jgi:hypothetical protein
MELNQGRIEITEPTKFYLGRKQGTQIWLEVEVIIRIWSLKFI